MKYLLCLIAILPFSLLAQNKVGIGTATPLSKLDISAQGDGAEILRLTTERPWLFKQRSTGNNTRLTLQSTNNDKWFDILSQNGLHRTAAFLSHNTFSRVLLSPDGGEVGIGVEDPTGLLHVKVNSTTLLPQIRITESGFDFARIKMENDARPLAFWDIAGLADTVLSNAKLNFYFESPNGIGDRMTITGAGHVGIGTTNPSAKLDIIGGNWNLPGGSAGDVRVGNSVYNLRIGVETIGGGAGTVRMYSDGGSLMLGTNDATHLTMTTVGNVGIGTEAPVSKLRVVGPVSSTAHIISGATTYVGTSDVRAIEGISTPASGYGYGGYFLGGYMGAYAQASSGNYSGFTYAVYGNATGTAGTRVGIYGTASGGATNWAGYFNGGNVYVANELRIGSGALTGATGYKVAIDGKVIAEELRVQLSGAWPDYVFEESYALPSISTLSQYIKEHKHLPGVPSAKAVAEDGILVGEMQRVLLEKIEELTLHIVDLNARIEQLEKQ